MKHGSRKRFVSAAAVLPLVLVMSACGDQQEEEPIASTAGTTVTSPVPAPVITPDTMTAAPADTSASQPSQGQAGAAGSTAARPNAGAGAPTMPSSPRRRRSGDKPISRRTAPPVTTVLNSGDLPSSRTGAAVHLPTSTSSCQRTCRWTPPAASLPSSTRTSSAISCARTAIQRAPRSSLSRP